MIRRSSLLLVLGLSFAWGQSFTGRIVGTVTDPSGAVIAGAAVKATQAATNFSLSGVTNSSGNYSLNELPRGEYVVEVSAAGFKQFVRRGIELAIAQQARIDVRLEVGAVADAVEVTADASVLETVDSTLGKVVDNRRITELPLNTRNVFSLLYLTPGVTGSVSTTYGTGYAINGARNSMLDILVDGVSTAHPTVNGFSGNSTFPPVEAIAEFKVMGSNYSAEFGRSNGGIVNVVYKSGTNDLHGSVFEFLRNSTLDANDFFNNRQGRELGSFKRNQFGAMVNGPVIRNHTFFLASYEGLRERSSANTTTTVPTALQRNGDFGETRAANGNLIRIFDPFSTRASGNGFTRDQFPGNVIPASMIDPVARNVIKYYPQGNTVTNAVTNANNFFNTGAQRFDQDQFDIRIDHNLTDKQRLFGRFSWRNNEDAPAQFFPNDLTIAEGRVIQGVTQPSASVDYTNVISPTTVWTTRAGISRSIFDYNNQGLGFKPSSLGLPGGIDSAVDRQMFPRFGAAGYVNLGGSDHRYSTFNTFTLLSNLSVVKGNHTVKFGWEGRVIRVNVWEARSAGTFNFNAGFTQGPNPTQASSTAGNGLASLLLGTGTTGNVLIRNWKNVAAQSMYHGLYFQDDWRVSKKLTLNLGLRYDLDLPRTERYNRMNWFDQTALSPLAGKVPGYPDLRGGVRFVGVDGNPRTQFNSDLNNVSPRIGFAYELDSKTVVRGAYGHFFGPSRQAAQGTVGPFGFRVEYEWVTTTDGITPFNLLRNPYPEGFRAPTGSADGLLTQAGANLQAFWPDSPSPLNKMWNVTIQRELPGGILFETAYVGNRGTNLSSSSESGMDFNQLDPKYLSMGSALNQPVANPFYGIVNNGVHLSRTIARGQLLRPYPQFTSIVPLYYPGSNSIYHAWQNTFKRRFAQGFLFEGSYTWAKMIDTGDSHQNTYDIEASRALSSQDVAHRLVGSVLYALPIGRGHALHLGSSRLGEMIVGGWQVNGIVTFQSGTPLALSANNTSGLFAPLTLPNNNGHSGKKTGPVEDRLDGYFDKSVYSQPAAFTFGNLGRYLPDVRSDGMRNWDVSLFKEFAVTERVTSQFRAEFFNAFNTPRFGTPNTSVTAAAFGVVTSQANAPRQIQFGLKFLW
ncbi:MAG: TonB-dependent receptor [Bryobacterales bacterium]|nr:TonB-dependent receptor [Bryobacterales bacterium]